MNKTFRTVLKIPENKNKILYSDKIMLIGSCFTDNIGKYFSNFLFDVEINSFGVLYNPMSIKNSLEILIQNKTFTEDNIEQFNNLWFSFYHHSSFSDSNKNICLKNINQKINIASKFLKETKYLFITFGTSWIFEWKETGDTVSNCHKIPAKNFNRKLLTVNQIVENYKILNKKLLQFNPKIKIIFTVSPIRHLKDGAISNQLSKSTLIVAIHQLKNIFNNVSYFPSYEIIMDDLRDYRFYKPNMTHINNIGVEYIWDKFKETYLSVETIKYFKDIEKINKSLNHKPKAPNSDEYKNFIKKNIAKLEKLKQQNKFIKLNKLFEQCENFLF